MTVIMGALNGLGRLENDAVLSRLKPLIGGNSAWRHSAKEVSAYVYASSGDYAKAAQAMKELAEDATTPTGLRQRAREFAQAYKR